MSTEGWPQDWREDTLGRWQTQCNDQKHSDNLTEHQNMRSLRARTFHRLYYLLSSDQYIILISSDSLKKLCKYKF